MPPPAKFTHTPVADDTPTSLVLPMAYLQALWHHSLAPPRIGEIHSTLRTLVLAHGAITLQTAALQLQALAGPLHTTPLADSWIPPDPQHSPREGVCLVVLAASTTHLAAPTLLTAEDWLLQHAPAWRLSSRALRPVLAFLWLSQDGASFLGWRSTNGHWSTIAWLELAGSGLRHMRMQPAPSRPAPQPERLALHASMALDHNDPGADPDGDRYSRQRLALGTTVLHTLQHRTTVVIGLGRTGSPLVHSAVRLGMPVLGLDPDVVQTHNLDGDFSPLHEGWTKAAALRKQLAALTRPGASLDLRCLDVASPAAGALIAAADGPIVSCVDNSRALLWANAWALALNKVHLVVASGLSGPGRLAEAEIRVLLPGEACVLCSGGVAEPLERVRASLTTSHTPRAGHFDTERPGSLRSWSVLSGHHALRLLEQVAAGRVRHSLFRRLTEQEDGGLRVEERLLLRPMGSRECVTCRTLLAAGLRAVAGERLLQMLRE